MGQLPTNRTDTSTVAEHVSDHNELHTLHNAVDTIGAANIETTTGSAAKVAVHEADTTSVHGITNTANLVLTNDSRLSDARTPTGHHTSHEPGGGDAMATDAAAATASLRTLGTGATQAAVGNHAHTGTYVPLATIDAAADLLVGDANDSVTRLAKGTALQVLRVNAGATALEYADPAAAAGVPGEYGDGSDGVINFDGSTTVLGLAPSSSIYTLTRDIFLASGSQVSGSAVIKCANFRIFCNGTFTIGASAVVHNDGAAASGITGGAQTNSGTLLANGGGGNGSNGGTGSAGFSVANCVGGNGGTSGGSSGGPSPGGGVTATFSAPAATAGMPRSLVTAHWIASAATRWNGGGNGSGGVAAASSTSGGGGASGNVLEMYVYNLVATGLIRAAGGKGGDASGAGTGAGGGGSGGGGALILVYHTKSGAGSTFTAATNTPGGAGGAAQGAGRPGATGSNGVIYEIVH